MTDSRTSIAVDYVLNNLLLCELSLDTDFVLRTISHTSDMYAADVLGMRARLIELDPVYVDAIVDRWEAVTGKKARRA